MVRKSKACFTSTYFIGLLCVFILLSLPGCGRSDAQQAGISFSDITYREIPGVSAEEIAAIEALKEQYDHFTYGMLDCTESFYNIDGEIDGFTRFVCEWLTELFGIPFIPENYIWTDLLDGLEDNTIDFTGYLMPTLARRQTYHMTDPIAQRMIKYYRLRDSMPIPEIRQTRLPRYALVVDAATTHSVMQFAIYDFEPVYVQVYTDAYELMLNGEVDALVTVGVLETGFGSDVMTEDFMPPIFSSTSFAARNPDFRPFISVVQKALHHGAINFFNELYRQGYQEYMRHVLLSWLNEEETAFLKNNHVIPIAAERDNYPAAFFSTRYGQWQGIAFDILREVSAFTGLEFVVANELAAEWHELIRMLEYGDVKMVTHLARTIERESRFLWPESSFFPDQSILISKNELANISIGEVFLMRVGLVRDSVHEELFLTWFPDHNHIFSYESMGDSFQALIRGEIDMVMNTQSGLLYLTNFREHAGYKANIIFNNSLLFTFGLNKDENVLLSIIDKSMQLIDTEMISGQWLRRSYDYRLRLVEAQRPWFIGAAIALALVLIIMTALYLRDRKKRKTITEQTAVLSAIYDSIPGLVYTKDTDGLYTSCNRLFSTLAGVGPSEIIGKHPSEIKSLGRLIDEFEEVDKKVMRENSIIRTEGWYDFPGSPRIASEIIRSPLFLDSKVAGLLGIALDITERKLAEEEAQRMSARIEAIINNLPGMIFQQLYNPPVYTYTFVSEGCRKLFGYAPEEMMNGSSVKFFDMVHPDDIEAIENLSAQTIPFGLPFEITFRVTTRDGTDKWVWERSRVIEKNPDGTPRLVEGYYADVTELRQAEHVQKQMKSRIEAIISNLPGMVYQCIYDHPNYPLTFVSDGSVKLIGYKPEELVGTENLDNNGMNKYMQMVHPDDLDGIDKKYKETIEVGLPYEHSYRLIMKDGSIKWIWERNTVPTWKTDGTPHLLDGYVFDITEQKLREAAEMANRAKSEFLATMSHEIRTPMNSIMGFAELAKDSDSIPDMQNYLEKITDSTKWLLHIINDILDISKIEAGKMELDNTPFELRDVFSRCQSVILPEVKEKGLDLSVYVEPSAGKKLRGDPVRLYQILINLLSNAVKFTNTGTVKFSSSIKDTDNGNTTVYFEVKDTGIGMDSAQVNKIFDPFMQADSSTTRNYGGTGLGLAIARNIVELMGGKLAVESSPGAGSTFSFEITFDTIDAPFDTSTERNSFDIFERPHFDGLVLVCDDNSMNQEVICAHLARVGLKTIAVDNGRAGVEIVQERKDKNEKPFDLIFMDIFMPIMDGMEAASKIMSLNTGTPIVAMTANIMLSELEKYKKLGMPDCLGKPFTSQELWHILLKYMTPVSSDPIDEDEDNYELQRKLQINFFKNNQNVYDEITEAVAAGDMKLAHRLAHSLKGNAGLIGKIGLRNAAAEVEMLLKDGIASVWENKMNNLKTELMTVLEELKPLFDEPVVLEKHEMLSLEQTLALFDKLKPMLENNNTDCFDLLDELRAVPGTEELVKYIENFDFKSAFQTLAELKDIKEKEKP
ncbi:MAG: PAS domain-containing protein [Treponema sp.]|nr:PAS domain-containing protein [Treponema sp.]